MTDRVSMGGVQARPRTKLSFHDFRSRDREEVIKLLGVGRHPSYARLKSAVFDWQFARAAPDQLACFLVGVADDAIVALNGFMPVRIRFHGEQVLASWSCDTYVSPSYRGQGFGRELVRRASHAAPVMLGYGISDMSDPILEANAWLLHPDTTLLFCHLAATGIVGSLKNFGTRLAGWRARSALPATQIHQEAGMPFAPEVDKLWRDVGPEYTCAVERDAAYLNWKYHQHPSSRYITYAVRSRGRLRGLLIARHDPEESVIVDYCGPAYAPLLMRELAAAAVHDLALRRTIRIRCETTHAPMIEALRGAGFLVSRRASRFRVRCNLAVAAPLAGWFLMTGDSDNDMLTVPRVEPAIA